MICSTPFDSMSREDLAKNVFNWFQQTGKLQMSESAFHEYCNAVVPRGAFFKNLNQASFVLDLGAGEGSTSVLKSWPYFERKDIKLYGASLDQGKFFDQYDGIEISNFEEVLPQFDGIDFNVVFCAHFIEHMRDPERCLAWVAGRLQRHGRLYLEWPHELSKRMPRALELARLGFDVFTTNFFDDGSHIDAWSMTRIAGCLDDYGMAVETCGRVRLPWLGEQLKYYGLSKKDKVSNTLGFWYFYGWAQYLIAVKL